MRIPTFLPQEVKVRIVPAGPVTFGHGPIALIAGPCVLENPEIALHTARTLKEICQRLSLPFVFKSSFDKANRTSVHSYRGPGLEKGLALLEDLRKQVQVPVLTDIHEPWQAKPVAEVVDILQIPAFLCRQTDLVIAAAETGKVINVKKGQFLAPWDVRHIIEKIESVGNRQILLTERGTSFGYGNLVVDFRSLPILRGYGYPVVYDATHSLQLPGMAGRATGGQREYACPLIRAACAAGVDALFLEVHPNPDSALSDPATQIPLEQVEEILKVAVEIDRLVKSFQPREEG